MFDRLIEAAVARRIKRIVGIYRPTAKNGLVKKLYDQMGIRRVVRYELDLPATPVVTATHIRNVGPAAPRAVSMRTALYQLDAFTSRRSAGNPAAVMPMDSFPSDEIMRAIAGENNLAETAFFVRQGEDYRLLVYADYRGASLRPRHFGECSSCDRAIGARSPSSGLSFGQRPSEWLRFFGQKYKWIPGEAPT